MKNKPIFLAIILCMLLLLGWAVKHYFLPEAQPVEPSSPESITVTPPPGEAVVPDSMQEMKPAEYPAKQQVYEERSIDSQHISTDKSVIIEEKSADLSEQTMSIKKTEEKGYEIMSGVNVKKGVVHVQLDEENNRSIEIERNPANSNNEYQLMLKKKF